MQRDTRPVGPVPLAMPSHQASLQRRSTLLRGAGLFPAFLGMLAVGGFYWALVCRIAAVNEPWDAPAYWLGWYPLSIVLAAGMGSLLRKHGWMAGAAITVSQLPVMLINSGPGPLIAVGVLFLCILAMPAATASVLASRLRFRRRVAR